MRPVRVIADAHERKVVVQPEHLASDPPDLVLCSASLRTGRTPLFRLLWTAHPELKARFVLIVSPEDLHAPLTPARQRIAVQRPITADVITQALRRLGRS
jgi:hypothetical protein